MTATQADDALREGRRVRDVVVTPLASRRAAADASEAFQREIDRARADIMAAMCADGGEQLVPMFECAADISDDLLDEEVDDIVEGLIPEHGLVVIGGPPKFGKKTWISAELVLAIASGTAAFGAFKTGAPRTVVRILLEEKKARTHRRQLAVMRGKGIDRSALKRVHLACKPRIDLLKVESLAWIVASVRSLPEKPAAVWIDPLRDAHKGHEVDDMDEVTRNLRVLVEVLGCTVVVVHHVRKSQNQSGREQQSSSRGDELRGGGELRGRLDAGIYSRPCGGDGRGDFDLDIVTESRDGRAAGDFKLKLAIDDDARGRAVTASWTVLRDEVAVVANTAEVVHAALLELEALSPGAFHSVETVRERAKRKKTHVADALFLLAQARRTERATSGKGWRCVIDRSHRSGPDPDRSPDPVPPLKGDRWFGTDGARGTAKATRDDVIELLRQEFLRAKQAGREPMGIRPGEIAAQLGVTMKLASAWVHALYNAHPPVAKSVRDGAVYIERDGGAA